MVTIRERLRRWWYGDKPRPAAPAASPELDVGAIRYQLEQLLIGTAASLSGRQHVTGAQLNRSPTPYPAPVLPAGVVPANAAADTADDATLGHYLAFDDSANMPFYQWANQFACGQGFPGYPYLSELYQRSEYRAPCEVTAKEMTRKWIRFASKGNGDKADKIADIQDAFEKWNVRDIMRTVIEKDLAFGRAQIYMNVKPPGGERLKEDNDKLPLLIDSKTITRNSLIGFRVIEPMWTTPYTYDSTDPTSPSFYVPSAWYVMGRKIHHTRLLTVISRPVMDMLKPAYNFGGISMTQLMEPYVNIWLKTRTSVANIVRNFSIIMLKTNMTTVLAGRVGSGQSLLDRLKLFTARQNEGVTVLDKDTEELEQIAVPLSSLDQLQAQAQEHMAAPCHVPLVKLTGVTPSGLNASSEGEIQVFYDYIHSEQESVMRIPLQTMFEVIQLSEFGAIDEDITFEFIELTEPTTKERAEMRKSDGDLAVALIGTGVVSPDEVREKLAADPDSGYAGLPGPAPDPADIPGAEPVDEEKDDSTDDKG